MPETPPDPFSSTHTGCVAILEMYRSLREAGGGWIEAALLVAAQIVIYGTIQAGGSQ